MMNTFWGYVTGTTSPVVGSPSRSRPRTTSPKMRKPDYSLTYLQDQIEELTSITGAADGPLVSIPSNSAERLVEVVRAIAETLLWGEQNEDDSTMFDYFAEKGVMRIFVSLLNSATVAPASTLFGGASLGSRQIMIQLLQTMSLLLLNVKRQTSLYFLLSNNAINQLINNNNNLDFSDEEILSYYISLMKSISLRLSPETIHFFVNERTPNYFPLFSQSIRFFDHHDRMVRIAVRTITLAIFKLYTVSPGLQKFLQDNTGGYFSLLACQLRDLWFLMDRTTDLGTLQVVNDEMIDQLEYVAEIDRLAIPAISELLIEKLRLYAFDGVLLRGLLQLSEGSDSPRIDTEDRPSPQILSLRLSLFVLLHVIDIMDGAVFETILIQLLGNEEVRSRMQSEIKSYGPCYTVIIVFIEKLFTLSPRSSLVEEGMSAFGLLPPKSIDMMILVAQSLGRSFEVLNVKSVQQCLGLLNRFLSDPNINPDFKRPVKLTVIDSFRTASLRIAQLIGDTLIVPRNPGSNEMNYSVIDLIESVLRSENATERPIVDIELLLVNTFASGIPVNKLGRIHLEVFFALLAGVKSLEDPSFSISSVSSDLFSEETAVWADAEEINSPPTPPPADMIENESLATDNAAASGPLADGIKEGDLVDLGKRDRIFCAYLSGSGRASRYLVLDKTRLILVSPDLVRPGFATVKLVRPLRSFSEIAVRKDDQRILVLGAGEQQLGFEDAKRCHLALMHLETKRIELRKNVYGRIEALLRSLFHYHPC